MSNVLHAIRARRRHRGGAIVHSLSDTFQRPDADTLGTAPTGQVYFNFRDSARLLGITGGQAYPTIDSENSYNAADVGATALKANVVLPLAATVGLVIMFVSCSADGTDGAAAYITGSTVVFLEIIGNVATTLGSLPSGFTGGETFSVQAVGTTLTALKDGVQVGQMTLAQPHTGTVYAFGGNTLRGTARFPSFTVS